MAIASAAIAGVPTAWATHVFGDVPTSSPHHADVTAILRRLHHTDCATGLYCPGEFVRRDQMASFLRRGLGRVAYTAIPLTQLNATPSSTALGRCSSQQVVRQAGRVRHVHGDLTAEYFPFGATGGSTLSAP